MPARIDVVGQRFGRLLVTSNSEPSGGRRRVACVCDCGSLIDADPRQLRFGKTKSCGCLQRETVAAYCASRATHGHTDSPEHTTWMRIKGRCLNPRNRKFKDYGGRGIKVCDAWLNSFAQFLADMGPKPDGAHSIDRIDVDGDYAPGNCRWADIKTQARNKRHHRMVRLDGIAMPLSQACEATGVNYRSALYRLNSGKDWRPLPPPPTGDESAAIDSARAGMEG